VGAVPGGGSIAPFSGGECSGSFPTLARWASDGVGANSGGPIFAGALLEGDERFACTSRPAQIRWGKSSGRCAHRGMPAKSRSFRRSGRQWVWSGCGALHRDDELAAATAGGRDDGTPHDGGYAARCSSRPQDKAEVWRCRSAVHPRERFGGHGSPGRTSTRQPRKGASSLAQSAAFREVGTETDFAIEAGGFFGFVGRPAIRALMESKRKDSYDCQ
jgi:hypothetical protein